MLFCSLFFVLCSGLCYDKGATCTHHPPIQPVTSFIHQAVEESPPPDMINCRQTHCYTVSRRKQLWTYMCSSNDCWQIAQPWTPCRRRSPIRRRQWLSSVSNRRPTGTGISTRTVR